MLHQDFFDAIIRPDLPLFDRVVLMASTPMGYHLKKNSDYQPVVNLKSHLASSS
jgi:hypothetical protein